MEHEWYELAGGRVDYKTHACEHCGMAVEMLPGTMTPDPQAEPGFNPRCSGEMGVY